MRRLVGISSKTKKAVMAAIAMAICLASIHMAAAARTASLRLQQEQLEQAAAGSLPSALSPAFSSIPAPAPQQPSVPIGQQVEKGSANENLSAAPAAPVVPLTTRKRRIVISIVDRKLALLEDSKVLKTYPIAVGTRHTPSPDGDFVIVNRAVDPVYRHRDKEIPPGKDNPLGTRWMGLSMRGYGIHGTNVPSSVGKATSHGCFRMRKEDVEELYTLVHVGDYVTVRRERDATIAQIFDAPANPPAMAGSPTSPLLARSGAMTLAKSEASPETPVTAATVTTVETTEQ
jgi:lipoprotein-anchoring transpeptidase ErfK/SrfK